MKLIIDICVFGGIAGFLGYLGHSYDAWEFWIVMMGMLIIQVNGGRSRRLW